MSVTSGFFNSFNGDRKYNAEQMSAIFDGIINDGIFASIGTAFRVSAEAGNSVSVGIGRAWFNSTWIFNDSILLLTADVSEVLLHRYDAVIIEVDHSDAVRAGSIKIIKGTPSSTPQRPDMIHTSEVNQYPLAYIYRAAGSNEIRQADITNMIGSGTTPYITGILQVLNIEHIVAQWEDQWARWFTEKTTEGENRIDQWIIDRQVAFNVWFSNLQAILDGDVATNLARELLEMRTKYDELITDVFINKKLVVENDLEDDGGNAIQDSFGTNLIGTTVYKIS